MPTNTTAYDIGDLVRLSVVVRSTAGTATNSGVTLFVQPPTTAHATKYGPVSTTNSTVLTHTATGAWNRLLPITVAGRWTYQWVSTGSVTMTTGGAFAVRPRYASTST